LGHEKMDSSRSPSQSMRRTRPQHRSDQIDRSAPSSLDLHRLDPYTQYPQSEVTSITSNGSQESHLTGHVGHNPNLSSPILTLSRGHFDEQATSRLFNRNVIGNHDHKKRARSESKKKGLRSGRHHPLHLQAVGTANRHLDTVQNPSSFQFVHAGQDALSQPQGLTSATLRSLRLQGQRFADTLVGKNKKKSRWDYNSVSTHNFLWKVIPILPVFVLILLSPFLVDHLTRIPDFEWNNERKLNNRQCALNLFIEKQEPEEFNPDYVKVVSCMKGAKNCVPTPYRPPKKVEGTYRTDGQVKVISRFINSVADSFRSNTEIQQHILFTGTRDGGHLAEIAMKQWPPRGEFRTQIHVIADSTDNSIGISNDALGYGPLDSIERRFQDHANSENVHIYDYDGNKAGLVNSDIDDDDMFQQRQEEMFGMQNDDIDNVSNSLEVDDDLVMESGSAYPPMKKLLSSYFERTSNEDPFDEEAFQKQDRKNLIPYLHVDGISFSHQLGILRSALPLLQDNIIVTIGIEHSFDMDIKALIEFFRSVKYKTFFLGRRQIARIDHLCPEILEEILNHPAVSPKSPSIFRRAFQYFNLIPHDSTTINGQHALSKNSHLENAINYPPFFIALPRGRHSKEEMTIQHMYDLFGGFGGGGQIKTANDRKAPGKK